MRRNRQRGSTLIEFTMVGFPIVFSLISIFELARGMWMYHTLAHAVREGTRFAIVHGQNCSTAPNHCQTTVAEIARRIRDAGIGVPPDELTVTFSNVSGASTLYSVGPATLTAHLGNNAAWPGSSPGTEFAISVQAPFRSAISMFSPGNGPGMNFGVFHLPAAARETIQF